MPLNNKFILYLTICLMFWLASIEPIIDCIWHIVNFNDLMPTLVNKSTILYLGTMIYAIYFNKHRLLNILSLTIAPTLAFMWAWFFAWDVSDFIKHPDFGYLIFMLSPPILSMYCAYWVILCCMTIKNTNIEYNSVI